MKAKKLGFIIGMGMAIVFASCEDLLDLGIELNTDFTTVNFTVPPTDAVGEAVFAESVVHSELDSVLAENDMTVDDLTSVKLKEATITIENEDPDLTFDFFERMEAIIEVEGLPELVIASIDSIPAGVKSLTCDVYSEELMQYLKADVYTVKARGVSVAPITETLDIKGLLKFAIHTSVTDALN